MGGYRDHYKFIKSKDYSVNFDSMKHKKRAPTQEYVRRLNNVFQKSKEEFEHEIIYENYTKDLEDQGIFSTSSFDFLEMLNNNKNNNNYNFDGEQYDENFNRPTGVEHQEYQKRQEENNESTERFTKHIHETTNALPTLTDPTIYADFITALPDFIKNQIPPHQRNQILPKIDEFIEMYKRMENQQITPPTLADLSQVWNEIDYAIINSIPAFVLDSFEGIIINIDSTQQEYHKLKNHYKDWSLVFMEYLEFILLHELFHIVVTQRAIENDLLGEYVNYVARGRANYHHLAESSHPNLINFKTTDYTDANKKNTKFITNRIDLSEVELTSSIRECERIYDEGYYYPLEEALANHFAYTHHSRYSKNNPWSFLLVTEDQGVGYQDWHTFHQNGDAVIHAVYVELGWMIKGKSFQNGVNIIHDLIINSYPLHPNIAHIIRNHHSKQKSLFKNTRTQLKTIQKQTPVHLIIDGTPNYFATTADINRIKTHIQSIR